MLGKLIIISAPSGSGKTTIIKHLLQHDFNLEFSTSATSRKMRTDETHGKDYYFLEIDDFNKSIANNEFLEYEEVYEDVYYGTLKSEVERIRKNGNNVIFDVDIVGGLNIKKYYGKDALSIFIKPPSIEELERRLTGRSADGTKNIKERVEKAKIELLEVDKFDKVIVNEYLDMALNEAVEVVKTFLNS